ncbi:MAG: PspC domain-containing protein [Saprospiraceae bacterium]|nr:PspC domain-containing protein [Saprospiraceae bacterium]
MNKVLNINLGGYPFTIDVDAYDHLDQYLATIENHFRSSEGCEEIVSDIESRMAELFREHLGKDEIVTSKDVEKAILIMGTPEEFGADPIEEGAARSSRMGDDGFKFGKRLFRDASDSQVAGVCSGLSAYFGIEDPVWLRIAFVIFTLSGGAGILLYIILWAVLPEAKTPSDFLAMKGEPINVNNIGRKVEEEVEKFTQRMDDWGKDSKSNKFWKGKKKAKEKEVVEKMVNPGYPG